MHLVRINDPHLIVLNNAALCRVLSVEVFGEARPCAYVLREGAESTVHTPVTSDVYSYVGCVQIARTLNTTPAEKRMSGQDEIFERPITSPVCCCFCFCRRRHFHVQHRYNNTVDDLTMQSSHFDFVFYSVDRFSAVGPSLRLSSRLLLQRKHRTRRYITTCRAGARPALVARVLAAQSRRHWLYFARRLPVEQMSFSSWKRQQEGTTAAVVGSTIPGMK